MEPLQQLLAIEEIRQLKARYFRYMDTKDWSAFEGLFAPDAVMDMRGEMHDGRDDEGIVRGAAGIAAFVRSAVDAVETVHHGHTPEIELLSADSARGIWAMEDVLRWPEGGPLRTLQGYGHYHETYTRLEGRWHIASTRLERLRVDLDPPPPA